MARARRNVLIVILEVLSHQPSHDSHCCGARLGTCRISWAGLSGRVLEVLGHDVHLISVPPPYLGMRLPAAREPGKNALPSHWMERSAHAKTLRQTTCGSSLRYLSINPNRHYVLHPIPPPSRQNESRRIPRRGHIWRWGEKNFRQESAARRCNARPASIAWRGTFPTLSPPLDCKRGRVSL